ncbi:hypothetical protein V6N11_038038 [Hibiscus sabdariffa]|uniref:Uncharacterized protein n=1 Tax=Hibiscus sabdariffa TaxID=183260 RepID=A0ABR1ZLC8_9ROSI
MKSLTGLHFSVTARRPATETHEPYAPEIAQETISDQEYRRDVLVSQLCDRLLRRDVSANTALLICVRRMKCVHQQQHRRYASANNSFAYMHPRDGMLLPTTASQMECVCQQFFADTGSHYAWKPIKHSKQVNQISRLAIRPPHIRIMVVAF